jgi:hypothetical protein
MFGLACLRRVESKSGQGKGCIIMGSLTEGSQLEVWGILLFWAFDVHVVLPVGQDLK